MWTEITSDAFPSGLYRLENSRGTRVELCAVGAAIHAVEMEDRQGKIENIALSLPDEDAYYRDSSFAGAIIGPVAGRIAQGRLPIESRVYYTTRNEGPHTLHGGHGNTARRCWQMFEWGYGQIGFCCFLPDGLDGFPGDRQLEVRYELDETNTLHLEYTATTTKNTFLNLTSHVYWNLSGDFTKDASDHILQICADHVCINNPQHIPVAQTAVRGTVFDFRQPHTILSRMVGSNREQLEIAGGYNNAFLLNPHTPFAAELFHPISGRRLTIRTDYPGLVFYSGGYLPLPGSALAFEAQYIPGIFEPVLTVGSVYRRKISFQLQSSCAADPNPGRRR